MPVPIRYYIPLLYIYLISIYNMTKTEMFRRVLSSDDHQENLKLLYFCLCTQYTRTYMPTTRLSRSFRGVSQ